MKKLGTPIGAGPGRESENVGLLGDGTPFPLGRLAGLLGFLGFLGFLAWACLDAGWVACWFCCAAGTWLCGCDEDFWPWPLDAGAGVVVEDRFVVVLDELPLREGEGEVEPDVVLGPDVVLELEGGGGGGALLVLLVVVEVEELVLAGAHEEARSLSPAGTSADGFVPGGTSTVNVVSGPPRTGSTVNEQVSADAGVLPNTSAASSAPAAASTAVSLGPVITAALVLRPT